VTETASEGQRDMNMHFRYLTNTHDITLIHCAEYKIRSWRFGTLFL